MSEAATSLSLGKANPIALGGKREGGSGGGAGLLLRGGGPGEDHCLGIIRTGKAGAGRGCSTRRWRSGGAQFVDWVAE